MIPRKETHTGSVASPTNLQKSWACRDLKYNFQKLTRIQAVVSMSMYTRISTHSLRNLSRRNRGNCKALDKDGLHGVSCSEILQTPNDGSKSLPI